MLTHDDLKAIETIVDKTVDKRIKPIERKISKLQKDINTVVRVFDSDIIDLKERTDKLEAAVFI